MSESDILQNLSRMLPTILEYERRVRKHLQESQRTKLEDKVHRALAVLRVARTVTTDEAMELLSSVRLGLVTGLLSEPALPTVNELFLLVQPAHVQKAAGKTLVDEDRDIQRASELRARLQ